MSEHTATRRDLALQVTFEDGALTMRIGLDTLVTSAEQGPLWPRVKVLDAEAFARELAADMESDEDETGLTALMRVIDRSTENLVENCSAAIQWNERPEEMEDDLP